MMEAGRVKHHLANNLSDPRNTVLAVGYCAPSTLGARILRGDKEVSIHGVVHEVRADIRKIDSFSGHADYKEMIDFLDCQDKSLLKKLFLVHGEYETQKKYSSSLSTEGYKNIDIPSKGEEYEIEFFRLNLSKYNYIAGCYFWATNEFKRDYGKSI